MLNDLDRYHLVIDVIDRVSGLGTQAAGLRQEMVDTRLRPAPGPASTASTSPKSPIGAGRMACTIFITGGPTCGMDVRVTLVGTGCLRVSDPYSIPRSRS